MAPTRTRPIVRLPGKWVKRWSSWWRQLSPWRQDRLAMLAPLLAVVLFLAAIAASFTYLRFEELERESEAVERDAEYAQQRLRLRLLERQEEFTRLSRDLGNRELSAEEFKLRASNLIKASPEVQSLVWLDDRYKIMAAAGSALYSQHHAHETGELIHRGNSNEAISLALETGLPFYNLQLQADRSHMLYMLLPYPDGKRHKGVVVAEYALDGLYHYGIPSELSSRYAISFIDDKNRNLAGVTIPKRNPATQLLPWASYAKAHDIPVTPVGQGLSIRVQAYRTSLGVVGSGLFWLVCALSGMTTWMLVANWRHTRRRMQAQQALVAETNFRRAMENSMPTGMRALDLQGRITYVNTAFCRMTGWSEHELVGQTPPFSYWPDQDIDYLQARLNDELSGRIPAGGFQVRVKRRDNTLFDARIYVSPLVDPRGQQTGWMTSITDITEPNRVREQLSASYERFTTVLEALDASVSVAPIGSGELLFANKMYRQWFMDLPDAHVRLTHGLHTGPRPQVEEIDQGDGLAGIPTSDLSDLESESAEIFVNRLGKWMEVRSRYLTWVDGRLAQLIIATDITERHEAELQAAEQARRAETSSRLITMGEMASSVAHELNQPLTAINNYCNGMLSRLKAKQMQEEDLLVALEKTAKQAQRAGQIIQRIRSFVKRSEPNRTCAQPKALTTDVLELTEGELRRLQVRLSTHIAERLPDILVDPILIEQVLVNLLKNAADAINQSKQPQDKRQVELRVLPTQREGMDVVEFSVEDTGPGIDPQQMEKLYEAFYTTKPEGLGIGLSLCRSIVESHKGRLQARNIYNGSEVTGCCFSFWIPLAGPISTPFVGKEESITS